MTDLDTGPDASNLLTSVTGAQLLRLLQDPALEREPATTELRIHPTEGPRHRATTGSQPSMRGGGW